MTAGLQLINGKPRQHQKLARRETGSKTGLQTKQACKRKRAGRQALLQKLCRPYFPEKLDLILIDGATPLMRVRAPPETWTTRLRPCGQSERVVVEHFFDLVINFSNDCSKFEQFLK
jgi:hypothetical protein